MAEGNPFQNVLSKIDLKSPDHLILHFDLSLFGICNNYKANNEGIFGGILSCLVNEFLRKSRKRSQWPKS